MSQENVEVFRQVIDAWNQRDEDLAVSCMAPDVEWAPAGPAAVDRTVYRGREECSRVVLLGGKIVRVHAFLTWREALEAAVPRE